MMKFRTIYRCAVGIAFAALMASFTATAFAQLKKLSASPAQVSDAPPLPLFRLGVFGGYGINYHHTNSDIFSCPECGAFSSGTGHGFTFNVFGEVPFLNDALNA